MGLINALPPALDVLMESGWRHGPVSRVPDVAVYAAHEEAHFSELIPLVVVEVPSPGTRGEDTLRKSGDYAAAGIDQYWILDPEHHTLTVLANTGGGWEFLLELDVDSPRGGVAVGEHGVVPLDLDALLAP